MADGVADDSQNIFATLRSGKASGIGNPRHKQSDGVVFRRGIFLQRSPRALKAESVAQTSDALRHLEFR